MRVLVHRRFSFDAAHLLPNYDGKCRNLHGHSWQVEVVVEGPVREDGMVFDFSSLKRLMAPLLEELDHHCLNDVKGLDNPTAENLCLWFCEILNEPVTQLQVRLSSVKVWESQDSYAEVILE